MKLIRSAVALFACLFVLHTQAHALSIQALAPEFAPLQYKKQNVSTGYTVEIVRQALINLKVKNKLSGFNINIVPWKRGMAITESQPNTLFFSISRTPQREEKFNWIFEISPYEIYFFKLKLNQKVKSKSISEALKNGDILGVQKGSNTEGLLLDAGFQAPTSYIPYAHYTNGIPMLFHGRFDMLPLTIFVARTNTCKLGLPGDDIEPVFRVDELSKPLWLVASKGTHPMFLKALKQELKELKESGFIEKIQTEYLEQWKNQPCLKTPN